MTEAVAAPIQVVICHKKSAWLPREPSVAQQLEPHLVGDPRRQPQGAREWMDLSEAIPLADEINLCIFTGAPSSSEVAGALLDDALHTLVIALVDSDLLADSDLLDWLGAASKKAAEKPGRHRFLAVMRGDETQQKWEALKKRPNLLLYQTLDFSKTGERSERVDWLALRVLYEVLHMAAVGAGVPKSWRPQIFVSHAKKGGVSLAKGLKDLIGQVPWLESFYDARDLGNSCPWEQELEEAVASSVLVALRTDQYDYRPYCQKEIRWAERYGVPLVLVDARQGVAHAASRLPFESAPFVRISDGDLVRILHAALRVVARAEVFGRWVAWQQENGQIPPGASLQVISVCPGMSAIAAACETLARRPQPRVLSFPGPLAPGQEQAAQALASQAGVRLVSQATRYQRAHQGLRAGISVSESDDLAQRGATGATVSRLTVSLSRRLLAEGGCLAFGHDWREEGIMNALCSFALEARGVLHDDPDEPAILNLVPWPDESEVARDDLEALEGLLVIEQAGLPEELLPWVPKAGSQPEGELWRYLRSRGLTHLRRELVRRTAARICVGGRATHFGGRFPGVLEEALLSLQAGQPTYFVGLLGGVAEKVGRAILDSLEQPPGLGMDPFKPTKEGGRPLFDLYRELGSGSAEDDAQIDLAAVWEFLRTFGAENLARLNALTVEENRLLLDTRREQEAIHLVLRGLRRWETG
jgi:hypothetical protein